MAWGVRNLISTQACCLGKRDEFEDWSEKNIREPIRYDALTFLGLSRAWRYGVNLCINHVHGAQRLLVWRLTRVVPHRLLELGGRGNNRLRVGGLRTRGDARGAS